MMPDHDDCPERCLPETVAGRAAFGPSFGDRIATSGSVSVLVSRVRRCWIQSIPFRPFFRGYASRLTGRSLVRLREQSGSVVFDRCLTRIALAEAVDTAWRSSGRRLKGTAMPSFLWNHPFTAGSRCRNGRQTCSDSPWYRARLPRRPSDRCGAMPRERRTVRGVFQRTTVTHVLQCGR